MKLVIGLVGHGLAGKEIFVLRINELLASDGITSSSHRFSDIIRETLTLWDIPMGRENEQKLPCVLKTPEAFGGDVLSHAVQSRLRKNEAEVGILDGVRWLTDEKMILDLASFAIAPLIVFIDADQKLRYERMKARGRNDEETKSWDQFLKEEQAENEIYIDDIGSRADITIKNNGTIEEYLAWIDNIYETKIKQLLAV